MDLSDVPRLQDVLDPLPPAFGPCKINGITYLNVDLTNVDHSLYVPKVSNPLTPSLHWVTSDVSPSVPRSRD